MKKATRELVYQKYNGHCAYCGKELEFKDMQVDHINPKYLGGNNNLDNFNPSCRSCNFRKSTLTLEKFKEELTKQYENMLTRSFQLKQCLDYDLIKLNPHPIVFYFEKFNEEQK